MSIIKNQIKLRPVRANDQAFVVSVFASSRAERFANAELEQPQLQQILEMQFNAQKLQYQTQYPNADFSLVIFNDRPIGYFYVDRGTDCFVLIDIALLAEKTGRGIGTHIVSTLKTEAFKENKSILAHVDKRNVQAWSLWQRLGFQVVADNGIYLEIECRAKAFLLP